MTQSKAEWKAAAKKHGAKWFSRLFATSPTEGVKQFFKHLSIIVISFFLARVLSAVTNIVLARALGPAEFGNSQLVITVSQLFTIFGLFGLNVAVIKFGSSPSDRESVISTCFAGVLLGIAITALVGYVWAATFSRWIGVSREIYALGLICGIASTALGIVGPAQQAIGRFGLRGILELTLSGSFLACAGLFLLLGSRSYTSASFAYIISYALSAVIGLIPIVAFANPRYVSRTVLRHIVPFAYYNFVCGIGFFCMYNLQRFLLLRYLSNVQVGVFGLYSTASLNLAAFGGSMIATVFFPRASASSNRERLWNVTARAWAWGCLPLLFMFCVAQAAVILVSGKAYPLDLSLVLLFALASTLITVTTNLGQITSAEGVSGAKLGMIMSIVLGAICVVSSLAFIPVFKLHGAVLALVISYAVGLIWLTVVRRRYF